MNWEAIFWFIAMVGFLMAEAATVTLVSIWFAAGSLVAIVVAMLGGSLGLQVVLFLATASLLLISLRGIVRKYIRPRITSTNVDSVIGAVGVVTTPVNNIAALGQVKLGSMEWSARSTSGSHLNAGTLVRVDRVEGVKVFVSPVEVPEQASPAQP
jgi:membrane protein implicated in regulation of membrane protease activity